MTRHSSLLGFVILVVAIYCLLFALVQTPVGPRPRSRPAITDELSPSRESESDSVVSPEPRQRSRERRTKTPERQFAYRVAQWA
jgi:hypothetical protein